MPERRVHAHTGAVTDHRRVRFSWFRKELDKGRKVVDKLFGRKVDKFYNWWARLDENLNARAAKILRIKVSNHVCSSISRIEAARMCMCTCTRQY